MKKYFLTIVLALAGIVSATASDIETSLGASYMYASKVGQSGIGVNYKLKVNDHLRISPEVIFYLSHDNAKAWNGNVNFEYEFNIAEQFNFYPILGFTYGHWTYGIASGVDNLHVSLTEDCYGANIGAGVEYVLTPKWVIAAEVRGQIVNNDHSQCVVSLGARYCF